MRNGIDGVWLTPVTTHPDVVAALRAASAGSVAIGGTADPLWRPDEVRSPRAELRSVDGADHALEVTADWRRSLRLQSDVLAIVDGRIAALTR